MDLEKAILCLDGGARLYFTLYSPFKVDVPDTDKTIEVSQVIILCESGIIGPDIVFLGYEAENRAGFWFTLSEEPFLDLDVIRNSDGSYYLDRLLTHFPGSFELLDPKDIVEIQEDKFA